MSAKTSVVKRSDERVSAMAHPGKNSSADALFAHVKTYGCQMNVYDSERMEELLAAEGYIITQDMEKADIIVLNTCHIREKAAEKIYSEIGRIRALKQRRAQKGENQKLLLGVAGCVAQAEGEEILRRAPLVDFVAGPQAYHKIGKMIKRAKSGKKTIERDFEIEEKFETLAQSAPQRSAENGVNKKIATFVTIQEGCDKFCSFCVVPYTRGAEISRSREQILAEAHKLVEGGTREITLLGQNVNAWHGKKDSRSIGLGELLGELAQISGIERLRYTTSHPVDMDQGLIDAHRNLEKLMPYLHLPVQSGSDRILKAMNRHHSAADYLDIIERVRKARPDIAISGDFIVGFPGESEAEFNQTIALVKKINYASAFSFKYSARPGTPGAELDGQIDETEKSRRLAILQSLLKQQQFEFNSACVGQTMDILLEKPGRKPGQLIGRSPYLQAVVTKGAPKQIGTMAKVRISHAGPASLLAEPLEEN